MRDRKKHIAFVYEGEKTEEALVQYVSEKIEFPDFRHLTKEQWEAAFWKRVICRKIKRREGAEP